jgi:hypothetical protein
MRLDPAGMPSVIVGLSTKTYAKHRVGKAARASISSVTLRGSCRGAVILCVLDVGDDL